MNIPKPSVQGIKISEIQTNRFTESLKEIITPKHDPKTKFQDGVLIHAKANINKPLNNAQLNHLCYFADSWNQDIEISRSGAGLKIEFTLREN